MQQRKTKGRKLGETYLCSVCEQPFVMEHSCQHICKRDACKAKAHTKAVKQYKKTESYKKWSKEYGKDWYYNQGGKAWLKKWRDKNRQKLNSKQRVKRYDRPINRRGAKAEALSLGYRSMAEVKFAEWMLSKNISFGYETDKFAWQPPPRKYTPDFLIFREDGTFFFVEYKGRLTIDNRSLLKIMKATYPHVDLRLVFQNARKKLYKGSKTTYGQWATQYKFKWAEMTMPEAWLDGK